MQLARKRENATVIGSESIRSSNTFRRFLRNSSLLLARTAITAGLLSTFACGSDTSAGKNSQNSLPNDSGKTGISDSNTPGSVIGDSGNVGNSTGNSGPDLTNPTILATTATVVPDLSREDGVGHFKTDVRFDFGIEASERGTHTEVPEGGTTCTGAISVRLLLTTATPTTETALDITSPSPECASAPVDCPSYSDGRVTLGNSVSWLGPSEYEEAQNYPASLDYPTDLLRTSATYSAQRVNYRRSDGMFMGKEGHVAVICKGTVQTTKVSPSGVSTLTGELPLQGSVPNSTRVGIDMRSETGTWQIVSTLAGVQCFGVLQLLMPDDSYHATYLFRRNPITVPPIGETRTVVMENCP